VLGTFKGFEVKDIYLHRMFLADNQTSFKQAISIFNAFVCYAIRQLIARGLVGYPAQNESIP